MSSGGHTKWCSVCNIAVTSAQCMVGHLSGQRHRKNIKKGYDTTSDNKLRCDVCNVPLPSGAHAVDVHVKGQKHQRKAMTGNGKLYCDDYNLPLPSAAHIDVHVKGREHQKKVSRGKSKLFCDVCDVPLTSSVCMASHIQGRQHQKKVNSTPEIPKPSSPSSKLSKPQVIVDDETSNKLRCDVCDVPLPSAAHIDVHVRGRKPQENVNPARKIPRPGSKISKLRFTAINGNSTANNSHCDVCGLTLTSPFNMEIHLRGKKHHKKAMKGNGKVRCYVCDVPLTSFTCMAIHIQGRKHRKKVSPAPDIPNPASRLSKRMFMIPEALREPINHDQLLTMLDSMVGNQTGDDILDWLAKKLLLTDEHRYQRDQFRLELQEALRSQFNNCTVETFGSSVSGLGFRACDLDLCVSVDAVNHDNGLEIADDIETLLVVVITLYRLPWLCTNIVPIPFARVPIVKFRAPQLEDIQCDLSFQSRRPCQSSRLVDWLMKADRRARPVTVAILYWAKQRRLAGGDPHPLKMPSYCLTLMVVTFLQQLKPPVLPTVDWCQAPVDPLLIGPWNAAFAEDAVWCSANATPASQLLRQFFQFYAEFAAKVEALCPLLGGPLPRSRLTDPLAGRRLATPSVWTNFCDLVAAGQVEPLAADTALVLQDPMEINYNVARNFHQLGLQRFRECCREAAIMPLTRLFDEQALPKLKAVREGEAAAAAAVVAAAAASAADSNRGSRSTPKSAAKRSLEVDADQDGEPAGKKIKRTSNGDGQNESPILAGGVCSGQSAEVSSSNERVDGGGRNGSRPAPSVLFASGQERKTTVGPGSGSSPVPPSGCVDAASVAVDAKADNSSSGAGRSSSAVISNVPLGAGKGGGVATDPALLRRVLADLDRKPNHIISVPLAVSGSQRPRSGIESSRHAVAFARFLEEVFSVVMRFECRAITFDDLDLAMDLVRGYTCSARLPTWEYRKAVTAQLVDRQKTLQFESEVTERALRMAGQPAPSSRPLATFSCYLVLEGDHLRLCVYKLQTAKAGKNCHPFLASFLVDLARRVDYVTLFGEDLPKEK